MTETRRPIPSGVVVFLASLAFLIGMHLDALARVMWVEDRVGAENSAIVDIVNGYPPSVIIMTILALMGLGVGSVIWVRDRRTPASG
jgi:hypothetical protein